MAEKSLRARIKAQRKQLKLKSQGAPFFTIREEGTVRMRPLPVGEEKDFAQEVVFFYLSKEAGGGFVSPATFGKRCPVMEAYNELSKSKKASERDLAKRIKPQKKFMVPHIRYKDTKGKEVDHEAGAKLLILSSGQYQALLDLWLDDEAGDFTHPTKGYDIKYSREGKGKMDTRYSLLRCNPSKLPEKYNTEYDPVEMTKALIPTREDLRERLDKFIAMGPEEDFDEEKPAKKKKKKSDM